MPIRHIRGSTSGQKQSVVRYADVLTPGKKPEKRLLKKRISTGGRNAHGHITCRHRGGGAKRRLRVVDFSRADKMGIPARVAAIEYDPGRTAFLALLFYADGEKRYILAPEGTKVDDRVVCQASAKPEKGNRMQIQNVPAGYTVHDIELVPGGRGTLVRSAGAGAKIVSHDGARTLIGLPSGEVRSVEKTCLATIGSVSNPDHMNARIGKAGRKRRMGIRPTVLGKSMNAADHPHGGGEGHSPIGLKNPKTPWGAPALGLKTRRKKLASSAFILRRRKKGRR